MKPVKLPLCDAKDILPHLCLINREIWLDIIIGQITYDMYASVLISCALYVPRIQFMKIIWDIAIKSVKK